MNLRRLILFVFIFLALAFLWQYFYIENYLPSNSIEYKQKSLLSILKEKNKPNISIKLSLVIPINNETKFLIMQIPKSWNGECGGLANQMWRLAVLFSIAKSVGRFPGISNTSTWTCDKLNYPNEIEETFPILYSSLRYMQANPLNSVYDNVFDTLCCSYKNVTNRFGKHKENNLIIAPPPQARKYLENNNAEIKQLFRFSKKINIKVIGYINELFRNDSSHKLCVHTRRGDFGPPKWPMHGRSEKLFTEAAVKHVLQYLQVLKVFKQKYYLKEKYILNVSIVMMGEDKDFLNKINISLKQVNKIHFPKKLVRTYDMCFGVWACDSLIITASSSTFAWWIGYLLEEANSIVFYNSDFTNSNYNKTNFPSDWIPLKLDSNMNKILME